MQEWVAFDTNDPVNPEVKIFIKGKVFGGLKLSSPSLDFGRVAPGTKACCEVKVLDGRRPDNRSPLRLHHDNTDFSVGPLANPTATEGNGIDVYVLPIEVQFPPRAREISDRIAITDESGYQLCSLPVYARSRRQVEFYPSEVLLPVPGIDQASCFEKRCLCVAESGSLELKAKDVPNELSVEVLHISDSRKTVIIRRCARIAGSGRFHGKIVFAAKVNGLEAELLEVPVTILDEAPQ